MFGTAAAQKGLITRAQLLTGGMPDRTIDGHIDRGRLVVVHPGVYRVAGAPRTWEQDQLAAVLAAPDSVASHRAAVSLWGIGGDLIGEDVVEITSPHARSPKLVGVETHRTDHPGRPVIRHGIPTTDPLRTIADLGAVCPAYVVSHVLEVAIIARLVTIAAVQSTYVALSKPGRRGLGVLREVLEGRALGVAPSDSILEARFAALLRRYGLPAAVFQHWLTDRIRVDVAFPRWRIVVEIDGWAAHASPEALTHDTRRQNEIAALGWTVLRFTWEDVVRHPQRVSAELRRWLDPDTSLNA